MQKESYASSYCTEAGIVERCTGRMNTLITICARGGSSGLPGKNIRPLLGQPLLVYSIRQAQDFARSTGADIALSTDSPLILAIAEEAGLKTEYKRPAELATDSSGKIDVMRHVLSYEEGRRGHTYDFLLDLDVTCPLRTKADLDAGYEALIRTPDALNIFSVSSARRNPYFNMLETMPSGFAAVCKKPNTAVFARQDAPQTYEMNAAYYLFRRAFFEEGCRSSITEKSLMQQIPHMCFDVDTQIDFSFLEYLIESKQVDFPLWMFPEHTWPVSAMKEYVSHMTPNRVSYETL